MNDLNTETIDNASLTEDEKIHLLNLRQNPHFAQQMYTMTEEFRREVDKGMDAHEAETMLIEALKNLGSSMMNQWAQTTQSVQVEKMKEEQNLHQHSKKKPNGIPPLDQ